MFNSSIHLLSVRSRLHRLISCVVGLISCVLGLLSLSGCDRHATIPPGWTLELSAPGLTFVHNGVGSRPVLAGAAVWAYRGGRFEPITVTGAGWRPLGDTPAEAVMVVGSDGDSSLARGVQVPQTGVDMGVWDDGAWITMTHGKIYRLRSTAPDKIAPDKIAPDKAAPDKAAPDKIAPDKAAPNTTAQTWQPWHPKALAKMHPGVLWGAAANDVWMHAPRMATGLPPNLAHWDGAQWTFHQLSESGYIASMHGSSSTNVWAVGWTVQNFGKGALAAHWDGKTWTEVTLPTNKRLTDVFVTPAGVVWLSGFDGTLLRGDHRGFAVVEAPTGTITRVMVDAKGVVWVVVGRRQVMRKVMR